MLVSVYNLSATSLPTFVTFDRETAEIRLLVMSIWPTLRRPLRCNHQSCDISSYYYVLTYKHKLAACSQTVTKELQRNGTYIFRLIVLYKTVVQQYSLKALHDNRNSLKQKRDRAVVAFWRCRYSSIPRLLNKRCESSFSGLTVSTAIG